MTMTLVMLLSNIAMSASARPTLNKDEEVIDVLTKIIDFDEKQPGWKYFSLPFGSNIQLNELRVKINDKSLRIDQLQGIIDNNVFEYNSEAQRWELASSLKPGNAYLIYVYTDDIISLNAVGRHQTLSGNSLVRLSNNWNYIGIPSNLVVSLDQLVFDYKDETFSYNQAVDMGLISNNMFIYRNACKGQKCPVLFSYKETLMPGEVCLIYSYVDGIEIGINLYPLN